MGYHEASLRAYEADQNQAILDADQIEIRQTELARDMIEDGKGVQELVYEFEADICDQIARAMRNLDAACLGNGLAIDACLSAWSNIQRELKARAFGACEDQATKDIEEA